MAGFGQKGRVGSKDPGGMKRAFKTNAPHTRLDEDQPKETAPQATDGDGSWFESLGSRINRKAKAAVKKLGG